VVVLKIGDIQPLFFTHSSFFHCVGALRFRLMLRAFFLSSSIRAAIGIAGGGLSEATAGRKAAAAAEAAAEPFELRMLTGLFSINGRSRGGE